MNGDDWLGLAGFALIAVIVMAVVGLILLGPGPFVSVLVQHREFGMW